MLSFSSPTAAWGLLPPMIFSRHFLLNNFSPSCGFQCSVFIACPWHTFEMFNNWNIYHSLSGWDILSFQSRSSWFLFSETLKDTRDWVHSTRQMVENFSCHSCISNLCIIIGKNNIDTPLLSKDNSFSYESSICVSTEYSKRCSQKGVCYWIFEETPFCEQLGFSVQYVIQYI